MHEELRQWQDENDAVTIPSEGDSRELASRVQAYLRQASKQRVRALRKAYPPDVEFISALHIDCLQSGDDFQDGVLWRSHAERNLFLDVRGWPEASSKTRLFHPLTDILKFEDDSCVRDCLSLLQTTGVGLDAKLRRAAHLLDCTPTISGVGESLSRRLLSSFPDDAEECRLRYACRLCGQQFSSWTSFKDHIVSDHSAGVDSSISYIEYRKKVIGLLDHAGPEARACAFFL